MCIRDSAMSIEAARSFPASPIFPVYANFSLDMAQLALAHIILFVVLFVIVFSVVVVELLRVSWLGLLIQSLSSFNRLRHWFGSKVRACCLLIHQLLLFNFLKLLLLLHLFFEFDPSLLLLDSRLFLRDGVGKVFYQKVAYFSPVFAL